MVFLSSRFSASEPAPPSPLLLGLARSVAFSLRNRSISPSSLPSSESTLEGTTSGCTPAFLSCSTSTALCARSWANASTSPAELVLTSSSSRSLAASFSSNDFVMLAMRELASFLIVSTCSSLRVPSCASFFSSSAFLASSSASRLSLPVALLPPRRAGAGGGSMSSSSRLASSGPRPSCCRICSSFDCGLEASASSGRYSLGRFTCICCR
mmetsp:Transcript_79902/g.129514  ORF Transcript_79902/g.129514 Transcript_79902/m.129514 type:complete len:211 (-) Transcript_79902:68-700(-)